VLFSLSSFGGTEAREGILMSYVTHPFPNSSSIQKIEYDASTYKLLVFFVGGDNKGYSHIKVPPSVIESWLRAESKGSYYMTHIKNNPEYFDANF
jgi:hypothetical protein